MGKLKEKVDRFIEAIPPLREHWLLRYLKIEHHLRPEAKEDRVDRIVASVKQQAAELKEEQTTDENEPPML